MNHDDPLASVAGLMPIDRHLAALLGQESTLVRGVVALVSRSLRLGHSCLPLGAIAHTELMAETGESVIRFPSTAELARELEARNAMTLERAPADRGIEATPLVLDGERLYLRRYFEHECRVARGIERLARNLPEADGLDGKTKADSYFADSSESDDPQRNAVLRTLNQRVSLITGGPGTGKTTTVVRVLALSIERALREGKELKIGLLAPTGKAAERLLRATANAASRLQLEEAIRVRLPSEAKTIHRALGVIAGRRTRFRRTRAEPLAFDLVIVDEASMVDLALMSRLMDALKDGARLVLLGDADQLASVDAGSVLSELTRAAQQLETQMSRLSFGASTLTRGYRFSGAPAIMSLATGFRLGDSKLIGQALDEGGGGVTFVDPSGHGSWTEGLEAKKWLEERVRESLRVKSVEEALAALERFQVLCSLRGGPSGTGAVNDRVRSIATGSQSNRAQGRNYRGRRILIVENDPGVGLYNGDIGIVWPSEGGALLAHFVGESGRIRRFSLAELPAHEDAFAITIHKSQGSEYDEILLLIHSEGATELLTRELLYTGVTRARRNVTLVASRSVLFETAERRIERHSGLAERVTRLALA